MRTAFTAYTALALLATAHSATLVVTDDNGNAQWAAGDVSYSTMSASVGDVISFSYNSYHDVQKMADAAAYAACSGTGATELAGNDVGGGSGTLENKYEYTVTSDDLAAGTIYFACSYYPAGDWGHCVEGQAISVTVSDEVSAGAPAAAPRLMLAAAAAAGLMMYWV